MREGTMIHFSTALGSSGADGMEGETETTGSTAGGRNVDWVPPAGALAPIIESGNLLALGFLTVVNAALLARDWVATFRDQT